jgi:pyridoxine 5-phosphate synthase
MITRTDLPLLGVNIDHIATLRQLRGTPYPDLLEAARAVEAAGADQITMHLREDRRHIQDGDVKRLRAELRVPLNLEMASSPEIVRIACRIGPDWACLVPEKRQELTTEGGLDVGKGRAKLAGTIQALRKARIRVSLFVEPSIAVVRASRELGADAVELHTGRYCRASQAPAGTRARRGAARELERIRAAAAAGARLGLEVHAGHGFDYENVRPVVELERDGRPLISEYNIGHSIVCRAAVVGLERATREMLSAIRAP